MARDHFPNLSCDKGTLQERGKPSLEWIQLRYYIGHLLLSGIFMNAPPQTTCVLLLDLSLSHVCPQLSPLQTLSWLQPCAEEPRAQPGETHQGPATFLSFLLTPSCRVAQRSRHESHLKSCHHLYQELVQPDANLLLPPTSVPTLASGKKILSPSLASSEGFSHPGPPGPRVGASLCGCGSDRCLLTVYLVRAAPLETYSLSHKTRYALLV